MFHGESEYAKTLSYNVFGKVISAQNVKKAYKIRPTSLVDDLIAED